MKHTDRGVSSGLEELQRRARLTLAERLIEDGQRHRIREEYVALAREIFRDLTLYGVASYQLKRTDAPASNQADDDPAESRVRDRDGAGEACSNRAGGSLEGEKL